MLTISHTAHQRIPASKQTQPVQILSEFLVKCGLPAAAADPVVCNSQRSGLEQAESALPDSGDSSQTEQGLMRWYGSKGR